MKKRMICCTSILKVRSGYEQHAFGFVVEFCADVSSCIVVTFIEMLHGLNVDVLFTGPLHQIAHKGCGFG